MTMTLQYSDAESLLELAYVVASIVDKAASFIMKDEQRLFRVFWILNHIMAVSPNASLAYRSVQRPYHAHLPHGSSNLVFTGTRHADEDFQHN